MSTDAGRNLRRDAARNRERLLVAARRMFAERGPDVPLEDVAGAAEVSRTTLYRHFATREELAATVFEDNVARIEERAAALEDHPRGAPELFDFVLDMLEHDRGLVHVLSGADITWFTGLASRTTDAFATVLARGRESGTVHPGVVAADVLTALRMAEIAMPSTDASGAARQRSRARDMLHRALFTGN